MRKNTVTCAYVASKVWNDIFLVNRLLVWWLTCFVRRLCIIMCNNSLDTQADKPTACLFFVCSHRSLCWVGHLRIFITLLCHQHGRNLRRNISLFTSRAVYRRPPTGEAIRHNYGVLNRHDDTSVREDMQNASEAYSVYPLLLSEWPEKWRFVCCWIIITTGIYETHQAFSQEECRVWRWLRAASHQTADTVKQGFQTSCLLSPSLLNHHHSSQLYDRSHDISPVRAAAYAPPLADNVTMSLAAGRARLMLLFPVIKRWLPCCCVKRHLSCQLGLGDVLLQGSFFCPTCCFSDVASWIFHGFNQLKAAR